MKHGNKILKIGRNASHRKATLQSMSAALLEHKRITTTFGKAKALRRFIEPIITHGKDDSTHSRRQAFRKLNDKEAVKTLYDEVAGVVGDRPGGYTRIVKLGFRAGDAAEMAIIELVDYNDVKPDGSASSKKKTRRSRRSGSSDTKAAAKSTPVEETPAAEASTPVEDAPATDVPESETTETPATIAAGADETTPDGAGSTVVPPSGDDHPDAAQGAPTETGEPGPGADAENLGRSHDNR
ncbi:50S ribosomal protein L17 [Rubrivirga sp. IMCC45206]|uniref:50S ribosomal protein L17 n=1 Tax=Rubrivirga sp. IMCC45206 TaxID=3391614 RepID=UPI00398FF00A